MAVPRAFRFMARTMTRSPLVDSEAVPFEGKGLGVVDTRPDGRPLRALVTRETVQVRVGDRDDYVERVVVTYSVEDLPRMPRHGDWCHVDGGRRSVVNPLPKRPGLVDCMLAD